MTDNVAVLQGFTIAVEAHNEAHDLFLLVRPDTDYDGAFKAWDTDAQEWIRVNGWLFIVHETDGVETMTTGLRETNEQTMVAAHQAGIAYWRSNRPHDATEDALRGVARSCGWHGEDAAAWVAGFYGAKNRA